MVMAWHLRFRLSSRRVEDASRSGYMVPVGLKSRRTENTQTQDAVRLFVTMAWLAI
jgi:hypothetical protein